MAEYIDREKAERELLNAMVMTGYQSRAIDAIRYMPSEDVAPVKHGKWNKRDGYNRVFECSNCLTAHFFCSEKTADKYCPYCGAKMDLEVEE